MEATLNDIVFQTAIEQAGLEADSVTSWAIKKRSIDARLKHPKVMLTVEVYVNE